MIGNEHHPVAHAHILFRDGSRVSVSLDTFEVLSGAVRPTKRIVPAVAWILSHREELIAEYWRLNHE